MAARAQKYAPGVYKSLAGPDWLDPAKGQANASGVRGAGGMEAGGGGGGGGGGGLRQRTGAKGAEVMDGCVRLVRRMGEWKALRQGLPPARPLAILYVDADGAAAAVVDSPEGRRLKELAGELPGVSVAQMDVGGVLDELAKEVRATWHLLLPACVPVCLCGYGMCLWALLLHRQRRGEADTGGSGG